MTAAKRSLGADFGQQIAKPAAPTSQDRSRPPYALAGLMTVTGIGSLLTGLFLVWPPLSAIVGGLLMLALAGIVVRYTA